MIRKRLVLNFPGFEKTDSEHQLGRLLYSANGSGKAWGFTVVRDEAATAAGQHHRHAEFDAKGPGWSTHISVVQFRWNDIVDKYEFAPFPSGFLLSLKKFFGFFTDGTVWRYWGASKRYFGFTIFPFLIAIPLALLITTALLILFLTLGIGSIVSTIVAAVIALAVTLAFCRWPGEKLYIPMTIADWGFARDMVLRSSTEIKDRFAEFAEATRAAIAASDHDEIVIVGHSFGAVWAAEALGRALRADPGLLAGRTVTVLALGSSIAKIALAPGAAWLRQSVGSIAAQENIVWHEVQTKDDFIAFYKSHPFEILDLPTPARFALERIRFSKGMDKRRYREMRRSPYRTHRQYILHYDKRVSFDTMLRLFGPLPASALAFDPKLTETIANDGVIAATADRDS